MPKPVEESSSMETEMPAAESGAEAVPAAPTTTLDEAFMLLCRGMIEKLEDDVPAQLHVEEMQGWYTNGNVAVAWAHAILVLEQVLGVPLRG